MTSHQDFQQGNRNPNKRKRKSGLMSRLKKFGMQGKLGRGYEVDSETYSYFVRVFELCNKNEFETEEEKDIFVDNAFTQTENEEVNLSSNQLTSRVLESLISLTKNEEILLRFTTSFTPALRTICTDPFASHVLEKLLEVISEKWTGNKKLTKWFRNTCKYVHNNFEEFVFDKYANHVMRKVCQCLTGTVELFSTKAQHHNASTNRLPIPLVVKPKEESDPAPHDDEAVARRKYKDENGVILEEFARRFLAWPQFYDLFGNEVTSGFVQCLILTLRGPFDEVAFQGVRQTIKAIPEEFSLDSSCHLHSLEVCVSISSENEEIFTLLLNKYFKEKLLTLATHVSGHFALERLFLSVPSKENFEAMFEELDDHFSKIYFRGYLSVFTAIADGCKRLKTKQADFVNRMTALLGIDSVGNEDVRSSKKRKSAGDERDERKNFFQVLARFGKTFQPKEDGTINFLTDIQGCYVLQYLLEFHKPHKLMSSVLELDDVELSRIAQDPKGSHVIDSLFASTTVGDKNKEKVLQKLTEHLVTLACTKFGARVLDNLFSRCTLKQKASIAAALSPREAQLNANRFGKFLVTKYGVSLYKRDEKEWARHIGEGKKKKEALSQFVEDFGLDLDTSTLGGTGGKKPKLEID